MLVRLVAIVAGLGLVLVFSAAAQPLLERRTLTGNWNGVRPVFSAHGADAYLTYTGTLWANLHGGRDTGVRWNGFLDAASRSIWPRSARGTGSGSTPTCTGGRVVSPLES